MTEAELQAIQARCDAATPGPWEWNGAEIVRPRLVPTKRQPKRVLRDNVLWGAADEFSGEGFVVAMDADAAFVASARTDLPVLLAEVARLKGLLCAWCRCQAEHPQPCHCERDE